LINWKNTIVTGRQVPATKKIESVSYLLKSSFRVFEDKYRQNFPFLFFSLQTWTDRISTTT